MPPPRNFCVWIQIKIHMFFGFSCMRICYRHCPQHQLCFPFKASAVRATAQQELRLTLEIHRELSRRGRLTKPPDPIPVIRRRHWNITEFNLFVKRCILTTVHNNGSCHYPVNVWVLFQWPSTSDLRVEKASRQHSSYPEAVLVVLCSLAGTEPSRARGSYHHNTHPPDFQKQQKLTAGDRDIFAKRRKQLTCNFTSQRQALIVIM